MSKRYQWHCSRNVCIKDGYDIYIAQSQPNSYSIASIVWDVPDEGVRTQPTITLTADELHVFGQQVMDSLWGLGLRPTDGAALDSSLAAKQQHLDHISRLLDTVLPSALNKRRNPE